MGEVINTVRKESWEVQRTAVLDEVELAFRDGGRGTRYRVQVSDPGRRPFISRWFNDPVPAHDFMDKVISGIDPRHKTK